jgi:hypothetical protein
VCQRLLGVSLQEEEERHHSWWSDLGGEFPTLARETNRRREAMRIEQVEFWFSDGGQIPATAAGPARVARVAVDLSPAPVPPDAPAVPRESVVEIVRPVAPATPRPRSAVPSASRTVARSAGPFKAGRFFELNGLLDGGPQIGRRFTLPKGRFEARCRLWNDPSMP